MTESYDGSVTTDLRPSAFDALREENTTLATENERLREVGRKYAEQTREAFAARNDDADRFLRRIERLRRAVARERAHVAADHAALDDAALRLNQHGCAVRELARQRDDLVAALTRMSDTVLTLTGERNEARRMYETASRDRAELLGVLDDVPPAAGQHERLTGGE